MNAAHNNPVTAAAMEAALRDKFNPSHLEVIDESHQHDGHAGSNGTGFGTHFRVRMDCAAFAGVNKVGRHRMVYTCLQPFFDAGLHALAIEA